MPRRIAGLNRKSPSRNVTYEIEQTVDMDEAGIVFVEPKYGGAIRFRPLDRGCQVIKNARATRVAPEESPRVP